MAPSRSSSPAARSSLPSAVQNPAEGELAPHTGHTYRVDIRDDEFTPKAALWLLGLLLLSACGGSEASAERGTGGAGGDASVSLDAGPCWPGSLVCQGSCSDVASDPKHCGACGKACATSEVCSAGQCAASCRSGVACAGACVDTSTNPSHCGGCGSACTEGELCSSGKCVAGCPSGSASCSGGCVDPETNSQHCGTCGNKCVLGSCVAGKCHCEDASVSGDESDVDCGGSCLGCAKGKTCKASSDCKSGLACVQGACAVSPPMDSDLIGFWRFEGNGDDSSGKGHHGALNGASLVAGKVGQALAVEPGKCLTVPDGPVLDMAGSSAFSTMAWVQTTGSCAPADRGIVLNKENGYEVGIECGQSVLQEAIATSSTGWAWFGAGSIATSAWQHVAVTWDGSTVRHYVNGAEVFARALSGALLDQPSGLGIGCRSVPAAGGATGAGSWFVGSIDEVTLYRRVLSPGEVALHHQATK